ncbi:MAG: hypothetical protein NTU58_04310 [Candidatus Nealsonbacteria bacterium]|nr:hypothetical protein [Candidatus Nealsonbacteria bacterium]
MKKYHVYDLEIDKSGVSIEGAEGKMGHVGGAIIGKGAVERERLETALNDIIAPRDEKITAFFSSRGGQWPIYWRMITISE